MYTRCYEQRKITKYTTHHLLLGKKYIILLEFKANVLSLTTIRTNLEMVRLLKLYNGTNDVEAFTGNRLLKHRFETKWEYVTNRSSGKFV